MPFFELCNSESIELGVKMTFFRLFSIQISQKRSKCNEISSILNLVPFFELCNSEWNGLGVKMTFYAAQFDGKTSEISWKWWNFQHDLILRIKRFWIEWAACKKKKKIFPREYHVEPQQAVVTERCGRSFRNRGTMQRMVPAVLPSRRNKKEKDGATNAGALTHVQEPAT